MNTQEIDLIRGCLPEGRTLYHSYKDHYVFPLLSWKLGKNALPAREIKQHKQLGTYAQKPIFSEYLKATPDGLVDPESLNYFWPQSEDVRAFKLTLDRWGNFDSDDYRGWNQTSRRGCNLVLQLNFPSGHNRDYRNLDQDDEDQDPFNWGNSCHPVRSGKENTMSWARLDIDLDSGTALIEEIQTDWLRDARSLRMRLNRMIQDETLKMTDTWWGIPIRKIIRYYDRHIAPLTKLWDETTLMAAIWFLREELGIQKVYYHTWKTGLWFKRLDEHFAPPRSLYTKLPQRFGFECVEHGPEFILERPDIRKRLRKQPPKDESPHWWFIDLRLSA
ncbi:MAG: hypothetical protein ACSHX8_13055 [Opitutaceae bacterium]